MYKTTLHARDEQSSRRLNFRFENPVDKNCQDNDQFQCLHMNAVDLWKIPDIPDQGILKVFSVLWPDLPERKIAICTETFYRNVLVIYADNYSCFCFYFLTIYNMHTQDMQHIAILSTRAITKHQPNPENEHGETATVREIEPLRDPSRPHWQGPQQPQQTPTGHTLIISWKSCFEVSWGMPHTIGKPWLSGIQQALF